MILFEDVFYFTILKTSVPPALEMAGFLCSYMSQLDGIHVDLLIIERIMEEDHFHDPGMKCEKFAVMEYFAMLFLKDIKSPI